MVYLVCYDLKEPDDVSEDYTQLIDAIETLYPQSLHLQKSVWIVDAGKASIGKVTASLTPHVPDNANLIVIDIVDWKAHGIDKSDERWLNSKSRTFRNLITIQSTK